MRSCTHNVHQRVLGADRACAHGDAGGLCEVVRQLSAFTPESIHGDPFATWASLRPALIEHVHISATSAPVVAQDVHVR